MQQSILCGESVVCVVSGLSYLEAVVVGGLQGVTELFPVSSLGHSIILPALIGGSWAKDLSVSTPESPYLAFIVGLHVATALALLVYFWRDWVRIISGLVTSIRYRRIREDNERLAWLLILATIPVGIAGLLLEHLFRTTFGKPQPAAIFLLLNGLILFGGEWLRRRSALRADAVAAPIAGGGGGGADGISAVAGTGDGAVVGEAALDIASDTRLSKLTFRNGVLIGCAQILALLPGISRSGATMVAGLGRGLSHHDAARFSFLLATPVIFAAGALKLPDLFGPLGNGIHGQILVGSLASFIGAYVSVRFLEKYFRTRTLIPFAIYCTLAGAIAFVILTVR